MQHLWLIYLSTKFSPLYHLSQHTLYPIKNSSQVCREESFVEQSVAELPSTSVGMEFYQISLSFRGLLLPRGENLCSLLFLQASTNVCSIIPHCLVLHHRSGALLHIHCPLSGKNPVAFGFCSSFCMT